MEKQNDSPIEGMDSGRVPPHSREAEISVLGAAMLSKDALYDVAEKVRPGDFYERSHQEICEGILELHRRNAPVDVLTVCEELKKRNTLEMVGGRAYIASLSSAVPSTSNAGEYAGIVAEKAELRSLIDTAGDIVEKGYSDELEANRILDFAERRIFEIAQGRQNKNVVHLKDILLDNMNAISERAKTKGALTGVTTGFLDLDRMTSGLQRSDLVILAARPSMGKTAFALCVARNAAVKGNKVLIFSLEMSSEQLSQRLIAMEAGVDAQKLRSGDLDNNDWKKITTTIDRLGDADISIDDTPGLSLMEIKNKCRRLKAERGLDLIIVDYLQLMNAEGRAESRQQEISALSRAMKQLAREMDCPVLVLSQLSRATETRTDHRPILSDLRESGAIEQDADVVLFLYRDEVYNEDTEYPGECMEAAMPLYGHDMNDDISPKVAGLGFAIKMDKPDFIGKAAIEAATPLKERRVGIMVTGRGIIREECDVYRDGEKIGYITSGTFLPYLNGSYGMAIVESAKREIGAAVQVDVRGRKLDAEMVKLPFYKRGQ